MNEKEIFIAFMKQHLNFLNAELIYRNENFRMEIIKSGLYQRFLFAYHANKIADEWLKIAKNICDNWTKAIKSLKKNKGNGKL